jgi:hypothetical protein
MVQVVEIAIVLAACPVEMAIGIGGRSGAGSGAYWRYIIQWRDRSVPAAGGDISEGS